MKRKVCMTVWQGGHRLAGCTCSRLRPLGKTVMQTLRFKVAHPLGTHSVNYGDEKAKRKRDILNVIQLVTAVGFEPTPLRNGALKPPP